MAILGTFHKNRMCQREKTSQLISFSDTCDSYESTLNRHIIYNNIYFWKAQNKSVLLFRKTIDAVNRTFVSLMVFKTQGVFENFAFWDTVCNSVKLPVPSRQKTKQCKTMDVDGLAGTG